MPTELPFLVDKWTACSTLLTTTLLLRFYPQLDESMFVGIEVGQSLVIEDSDGDFVVTAFDADHCPAPYRLIFSIFFNGAVMFLFQGNFGNIFHNGDCRLTLECLLSLPDKYIGKKGKEPRCPLDYVFLDCTFGQFPLKMPNKHSAMQLVINCIWKHSDARMVYLTCDLLGQTEILVEVSQTFGEKIYVDKAGNLECFIVPRIRRSIFTFPTI